ncbi:class I SAM-dependent methyltransferase [Desulfoluna sp.]|uniref:class I SAM-dependent methyltransferase n=1 Tax=Desulfoluna sp. TaxID=2045199 RepID=UPI00260E3D4C|nr:class I SAM-dependent methyltransferase [Desulfoluna sp.]
MASSVEFSISIDIDHIKRRLPFTAKILDYGCGYGRISRLLKDAGYENIIGYDTSPGMIERGQRENPDLVLRHNETFELPEPSERFDAAIVAAVFTSLPDESMQAMVLKEMNRILNNAGVLILCEFLRDDQRQYDAKGCFVSKIGIRMKHFHESEIRSLLHGWDIIHFERLKTEAIGRSMVPAVHVIAHSSHNK